MRSKAKLSFVFNRAIWLSLFFLTQLSGQSDGPGLQVGARVPEIRLADQTGKVRTFDSIKGPKGAVLVFYRSADW
jgi:hypothetical protein